MSGLKSFDKVFDECNKKDPSVPTIYLGLYNAKQYLPSLKKQIATQIDQNFTLLVVDNNSSDETLVDLKKEWLPIFGNRIRVYKNNNNIGGVGLFVSSLDLIESNWVITLHQDDFYLDNHVSELSKNIEKMSDRVIIFNDMGSINPEKKSQIPYPRGIWGINCENRIEILQESIKKQVIPWPASAFNCSALRKTKSSWESTAFADNEITIQLLATGKVYFTNQETMLYNENQESESHSINRFENRIVGFTSMIRVLTSSNLINFFSELDLDQRLKFYKDLQHSITEYLSDKLFSEMAYFYIINSILVQSNHSDVAASIVMRQIYDDLGLSNNSRRLKNFEISNNAPVAAIEHLLKLSKMERVFEYYKNDHNKILEIDKKNSWKFRAYKKAVALLSYENRKRVTIIMKRFGFYK
jgi:glycosyltransferase involved in cell wall biosynthesis